MKRSIKLLSIIASSSMNFNEMALTKLLVEISSGTEDSVVNKIYEKMLETVKYFANIIREHKNVEKQKKDDCRALDFEDELIQCIFENTWERCVINPIARLPRSKEFRDHLVRFGGIREFR